MADRTVGREEGEAVGQGAHLVLAVVIKLQGGKAPMGLGRRTGFTLIELLVVIAIIGILAAMLFPVFARARESARKIQCLSNMKNIAMAVQMYLSDYDALPPGEHRPEVVDSFQSVTGCDSVNAGGLPYPAIVARANPYLAWPVILDEYIKNRDVWRCPSAKFTLVPGAILSNPDYFRELEEMGWGSPCDGQYFPNGWGGTLTDTFIQGVTPDAFAVAEGMFAYSIVGNTIAIDLKASAVEDPARYVIAGESGFVKTNMPYLENFAYPDQCGLPGRCDPGGGEDCNGCAYTPDEALSSGGHLDTGALRRFTRHMGGNNLAFMDGHAKWWRAESMFVNAPRWDGCCHCGSMTEYEGGLLGVYPQGPTSASGNNPDAGPAGTITGAAACLGVLY